MRGLKNAVNYLAKGRAVSGSLCFGLQYAKSEGFLKNLLENTKRYQAHFASQADMFLDVTAPRSIRPAVHIIPDTFDVLMNQVSLP